MDALAARHKVDCRVVHDCLRDLSENCAEAIWPRKACCPRTRPRGIAGWNATDCAQSPVRLGRSSVLLVPATDFAKNFGKFKEQVQREPIEITSHGRISGYFVSEPDYREFERAKEHMRRVYSIEEMPDDLFQSIVDSKMNSKHDHLNALLDKHE